MIIMAISLKEVFGICYEARHKWSNMLLALDVSNSAIESIRMKFCNNPDDCFRTGLSEWLSSGTERTWEHIAAALSSPTVDCKDIADQVAKKYLNETPDYTYTIDAGKPTTCMYHIYLIKRPGVYFLETSVEGAFKRDGRLFETGVYCFVYFKLLLISSYYALFGCCHSSQLKS